MSRSLRQSDRSRTSQDCRRRSPRCEDRQHPYEDIGINRAAPRALATLLRASERRGTRGGHYCRSGKAMIEGRQAIVEARKSLASVEAPSIAEPLRRSERGLARNGAGLHSSARSPITSTPPEAVIRGNAGDGSERSR